ncbi:MAG: GNAT family N-acetyltransferase [Rhodospirillaceae bacterium]|nr:GNAT family N-acetyltransferase [Rhodospirillaceae bacterium]MBT4747938.1 GNAT family N-acetyltransferase [Rhodospirillaceae bacterium]MBT5838652.1 GNAT family N-acetyltransferase [Rhodospirillaceae bacterium]MBT6860175.1 GNAT family N-acetyltransferase [Rhodospirillaceae bacterium]MBT7032184.1 GNAT family N-acetyltransferase [Rhodospirillaceae bacterium]
MENRSQYIRMSKIEIRDFSSSEWDALQSRFGDRSLVQDWAYGEAKTEDGGWRVERGVLHSGQEITSIFQALIRPIPVFSGGLVWINRAPLWQTTTGQGPEVYGEALHQLYSYYVLERGMYLRLAPSHVPGETTILDASTCGLQDAGMSGWASTVLDLTRAQDDLRAGLKQKWRNCLNKAERANLEIASGTGADLFAEFLESYRAFVGGRGFTTSVTPDLLAGLQRCLPEARKLKVFTAYLDGAPIASALIARYGTAAEYLAGTSTDAGRKNNAGQLLLWRALVELQKTGFKNFDLGGVDPELTAPGVLQFKTGMNGVPYRLAPEIEAVGGGLIQRLVRWRVSKARAA